jgi:dehydrogenase/reductase SDR family protein 12
VSSAGRVADGVDAALEWSIGGSFTRVGSAVRRRLDHWDSLEGTDLTGRVIVITGATSGLGLEAARSFARMGATLTLIGRNPSKLASTCAELRASTGNTHIHELVADTGDLAALQRAGTQLRVLYPQIHVLIHNAGALDDVRKESPEGTELTVASQVVGPVLLTELLLPALRAAKGARVLWVSSGGMYSEPLSVAKLEMTPADYDGVKAYARAKRAQVTLTELYAERLRADGIVVHAMHPGWADTPGVARSLPMFRRVVGPLLRTPRRRRGHAGVVGRERRRGARRERPVLARPAAAPDPPLCQHAPLRHAGGAQQAAGVGARQGRAHGLTAARVRAGAAGARACARPGAWRWT